MSRPKKHRRICSVPDEKKFNLSGNKKKTVDMTVDEYEVVRLIDYVGLTQQECAKQMDVARSTVTAIYDTVRRKISDSIVNNKAINIDGGDFQLCPNSKHCCGQCGKNRCGRCKHGACDRCIGIFREPGMECFVIQYN
ncbi:MAG TPA: DUF134 domain-containing protein [Candidatus Eubacterium faecigallinarum]|nr:DUF134 domain-containing protein [Candidatus Eubacterium faecigallinarum]